jgi:hypothetical protein
MMLRRPGGCILLMAKGTDGSTGYVKVGADNRAPYYYRRVVISAVVCPRGQTATRSQC